MHLNRYAKQKKSFGSKWPDCKRTSECIRPARLMLHSFSLFLSSTQLNSTPKPWDYVMRRPRAFNQSFWIGLQKMGLISMHTMPSVVTWPMHRTQFWKASWNPQLQWQGLVMKEICAVKKGKLFFSAQTSPPFPSPIYRIYFVRAWKEGCPTKVAHMSLSVCVRSTTTSKASSILEPLSLILWCSQCNAGWPDRIWPKGFCWDLLVQNELN